MTDEGPPFVVGTRERQNADMKMFARQMANDAGVQFADGVVEEQTREEADADASLASLNCPLAAMRRRPGQRRRGPTVEGGEIGHEGAIVLALVRQIEGGVANLVEGILDGQRLVAQASQAVLEAPAMALDFVERTGNDRQ